MKNKYIIFLLLLTAFSFSSCIQDEAPNAECDIISVDAAWLEEHKDVIIGAPIITNNLVRFNVKEDVSLDLLLELSPTFNLTNGANIKKIGDAYKKGESVVMHYVISSEDHNWWKDYEIIFIKQAVIPIEKVFSFENFTKSGKFYTWYEFFNNTKYDWWATGNVACALIFATADDFPTTKSEDGFKNNCIKLTTRKTGMSKMPIAAGNIFVGKFISKNAAMFPLLATEFGLQIVPAKPLSLKGYYKYTPGDIFSDKGEENTKRRDECAIYSVLFEVDPDNFVPLNGENITSSDRIVMIAEMQNPGEPTEWKEFNIPFEQKNGKTFDYNKLINNEYAITIVASSSKDGANFNGAVGSTLYVDELKIEWEEK